MSDDFNPERATPIGGGFFTDDTGMHRRESSKKRHRKSESVPLYAYCPVCGEPMIDKGDLYHHVDTFHAPVRQDFQFQRLVRTVAEQQRQIADLTARLNKLEGKAE